MPHTSNPSPPRSFTVPCKSAVYSVCNSPSAKSIRFDRICQVHQNSFTPHMLRVLRAGRQSSPGCICTTEEENMLWMSVLLWGMGDPGFSSASLRGLTIVCFIFPWWEKKNKHSSSSGKVYLAHWKEEQWGSCLRWAGGGGIYAPACLFWWLFKKDKKNH